MTDPWQPHADARTRRMAADLLRRLSFMRARSYRTVFRPDGRGRDHDIVLADLRDFCFADKSTFSADPATAAMREGLRRVWLRIAKHLALDDATIDDLKPLEADDGLG